MMSDYPYLGIDNSSFDDDRYDKPQTYHIKYVVINTYYDEVEAVSSEDALDQFRNMIDEMSFDDYDDYLREPHLVNDHAEIINE